MSKDNVEDKKHCKDCHYYTRPKCSHKEVNDYTARRNSCALHTVKGKKKRVSSKDK